MSSDNGHEHDSHYHGEPSRVLDDRPLPSAAVLYESNLSGDEGMGSTDDWLDQLLAVEEISRVYVPPGTLSEKGDLQVTEVAGKHRTPFGENFAGFSESIRGESSLLFLPVGLKFGRDGWVDLKSNDVSVNWLAVDTNPDEGSDLPGVVVLSDWITRVDRDVPGARATGVSPGIFHVKGEDLSDFEQLCEEVSDLAEAFDRFLNDPSNKLRPAFLHEREWEFN